MMHGTVFACLFERTFPKDGDYSSINVADFSENQDEMKPTAASSMRQLYDWGNPSLVSFALPGGQSGNPYASTYDNLFPLFSNDTYVVVQVLGTPATVSHVQALRP